MRRRTEYLAALLGAAGLCNIDQPRTPYAAVKEAQQRGVRRPVNVMGRRYLPRTIGGEGLAIALNQRSWS